MTTEPDTTATETTPEAVEAIDTTPTLSPEDMARELTKVRTEAAKWRTKLREREKADEEAAEAKRQAELTLEQRVKEAEAKAQDAMTAAETRVLNAERRAALAGKVANPERVMRLMDDVSEYFDGSEPNVDAILAAFPEYAPNTRPVAPAPDGAPGPRAKRITQEQLKNMTAAEINANWDAIKAIPKA